MKLQWDFKELNDFADKLTEISKLEKEMKRATQELARVLLNHIKTLTPIGDTYELVNGWNGNNFAVKQVNGGFEVLLVNTDEKASWVNDGHRVRNRKGGPYLEVHNRIKVPHAYKWQRKATNMYVFGHFFVERGILHLSNTTQIESLIYKQLKRWWKGL